MDDCASPALNPAERLVCRDAGLRTHDRRLNEVYRAAQAAVADPQALRRSQRAWLRTARDACGDIACLESAYSARWLALFDAWQASVALSDAPLRAAEAASLCAEVARAADTAEGLRRFELPALDDAAIERLRPALAWREDDLTAPSVGIGANTPSPMFALHWGARQTLRVGTVGHVGSSCHLTDFAALLRAAPGTPAHVEALALASAAPDGSFEDGAGEANAFVPIVLHQRALVVAQMLPEMPATQVAQIRPDGALLPVCRLQSRRVDRAVASPGAAACEALVAGRLARLAPDDREPPAAMLALNDAFLERLGGDLTQVQHDLKVFHADLAGDGRVADLAVFSVEESRSCGVHFEELQVAAPVAGGPRAVLKGGGIALFSHAGRVLVQVQDAGGTAERLGDDVLYAWRGGRFEEVCRVRPGTLTNVAHLSNVLDSAAKPPADGTQP